MASVFPLIAVGLAALGAPAQAPTAAPAEMPKIVLMGDASDAGDSPLRVTLAQELSYKAEAPRELVKNRSTLQVEYANYLLEHFFVQFNGKASAFLGSDHRRRVEGSDTSVSQAYVQTSFGQTSIKAGIQPLPWGESILAQVTDEVSPRDNRELFNFNLEELRIGQAMLVVDQFSELGRVSAFYTPRARFNKNPERGTAYFFDPLVYRPGIEAGKRSEYGASWKKNFQGADLTLMGASLLENDYALRLDADGLVTRVPHRFRMAGVVLNYALRDVVLRGEAAWKGGRPFYNGAMQMLERDTLDSYVAVDYRHSPTLAFSVEAVNQRISGWDASLAGVPRNRQSLLLSATKTLMNDDLSINLMNFYNRPYTSNLTMLVSTLKWDDHLTFGLNAVYPHTSEPKSGLWNVRDQKQIGVKVQYQF
jgi:hypothetical protein